MRVGGVRVSVVIPVYDSAAYLRECVQHLSVSTEAPFEVIVVDDGSTDASPQVARQSGAVLLSTGGRFGPAYARNIGAHRAAGDIVFFIDADVCVHASTVAQVRASFDDDPALDALIGSYDDTPANRDFISLYKNLMHCFVHQHGCREASTFWSGCGAIRRDVFLQHSGFDAERYGRPAIEDIELGYRLKAAGHKLMLDWDLQVKHLKRWTFWGLVKTDVLDRGIPWTELILRDSRMPDDLNLQLSQRVSVALVYLILGAALTATLWLGEYFLAPFFGLLFFALSRYWLDASHTRSMTVNLVMAASIGVLAAMSYAAGQLGLIPFLLAALPLLFLRHRYSHPPEKRSRFSRILIGAYLVASIACTLAYLPHHPLVLAVFLGLALVIILNNQFYLFLAAKQGRMFAASAIPFHLLYHFYNGISFSVGLSRWAWRSLTAQRAKVEAPASRNGR